MKTAALLWEAPSCGGAPDLIRRIREETGAEQILAVVEGDVTRDGFPARTDKYARADALIDAGASCVLELPLFASLLPENTFAFAAASLLRKAGCVDLLALPCPGGADERFRAAAEFLFDEPPAYQKRMRQLRDAGEDIERRLPDAVGEFLPGAEALLRDRSGRMAVTMVNTLRRSYSPIRPVPVRQASPEPLPPRPADSAPVAMLRRFFLDLPEAEACAAASAYCGGSPRAAQRVIEALKASGAERFDALSEAAAFPGMSPAAVRRFLIACLTGYRKVDSFVCITYNYIPYLRVIACDAPDSPLPGRLRETAGTTLIIDAKERRDLSALTDDMKLLLFRCEQRARELFEICRAER